MSHGNKGVVFFLPKSLKLNNNEKYICFVPVFSSAVNYFGILVCLLLFFCSADRLILQLVIRRAVVGIHFN